MEARWGSRSPPLALAPGWPGVGASDGLFRTTRRHPSIRSTERLYDVPFRFLFTRRIKQREDAREDRTDAAFTAFYRDRLFATARFRFTKAFSDVSLQPGLQPKASINPLFAVCQPGGKVNDTEQQDVDESG